MQPAEKALALSGKNLGGWAERGEAAVAEEQNFSRSGERVGGVVRGHDGLHIAFAQPVLQANEERIAGDAVER